MFFSEIRQSWNFSFNYLLITGCLLLFPYAGLSQEGLPFIYNFTSDNYAAGIQNWDITQGSDGRMYLANNFGLLVYNGKSWQLINSADGTKLRSVLAQDNRVYAGYQKNFGYYSPNQFGELTYTSLADSVHPEYRDFDEIWKIYSLNDAIYFCGFDYIFEYKDDILKTIIPDNELEFSFEQQMSLIVQVQEKGLTTLNEEEFELIDGGDFFSDKRVTGIVPYDKDSWLIASTNSGLFLRSGKQIIPFAKNLGDLIINNLIRLKSGEFALGTQNNGLIILNREGELITNLNKASGLVDNTVNSLFEDSQGNLWLSLNNGISRVSVNSPFTILDFRIGIDGAGYAAYEDDKGLYLGTNNGLFLVQDGRTKLIEGTEGQVYSIQSLDGHLLVGHNNGPMEVRNGQAQLLNEEKGVWTFKKIPNRPNEYLIGTYAGLRKLTYSNNGYQIDMIPGFDESSRVMSFDKNDLWITQGYKGAFKLSFNESFTDIIDINLYNSSKGFPTDNQINVFEIGNQLIFGSESGVFKYHKDDDLFTRIENYEAVLGGNISLVDIEDDELSNQYYIASNQIGRLIPGPDNDYAHISSTFNPLHNRWNDDLGNITVLNADKVLIGGREGFIQYTPSKDIPSSGKFGVQFNKILLNDQTDSLLYGGYGTIQSSKLSLPYNQNNITFEFSATHYGSEREMEYSYRLVEFNENWSDWSRDTKQSFTNLREGKYQFEVIARNIYQQETDPVVYSFQISPPIYRSKWAYGVYSFGSFAIIFLSFRSRERKYQKEKENLLTDKNKVIDEKELKLKLVSEKSESEIVKLRNEKLETELNMKNQALTSSAMNLIQKNRLLGQIKNTLKSISDDMTEKTSSGKIQQIIKSIERDLSTSEEWEQFELHFDQVHGQFITRLKKEYPQLTPQELKYSAYIRMNLNTKEIANLLNLSVRGVEIGRYRLRKKLELERKDNLSDFILRF